MLKLDILGHDDPTMIRMLEDLTGIDAREIPLDSPEVMSLFKDTSALGIKPEDIGGCKLGALGLPSLALILAMGMLIENTAAAFLRFSSYCGFVTWYRCMAWKCPDTSSGEKGDHFNCYMYAR